MKINFARRLGGSVDLANRCGESEQSQGLRTLARATNLMGQKMNLSMWLNAGKLAAAAKAAAKLSAEIGARIVPVLLKIVELENTFSGPGQGKEKLRELLTWAAKQFLTDAQVDLVEDFAEAIVTLLNVIKVFRK